MHARICVTFIARRITPDFPARRALEPESGLRVPFLPKGTLAKARHAASVCKQLFTAGLHVKSLPLRLVQIGFRVPAKVPGQVIQAHGQGQLQGREHLNTRFHPRRPALQQVPAVLPIRR